VSRKPTIQHVDVDLDELRRRVTEASLSDEDKKLFVAMVDTIAQLTQELESKRVSVARLRRLVFGARTEKLRSLKSTDESTGAPNTSDGETTEQSQARGDSEDNADADSSREASQSDEPKRKVKGHGRHGAKDYPGAEKQDVPHPSLHHGDTCPDCCLQ
jgi:transposase